MHFKLQSTLTDSRAMAMPLANHAMGLESWLLRNTESLDSPKYNGLMGSLL